MDDEGRSRRRRGAGVVTANACIECRKKRSKCDGQNPCQRCQVQNVDCAYAVPVRQSKDNMRIEIDVLSTHRQHSERVFNSISSGSRAQETLNRLRNGESLESISSWLETTSQGATESLDGTTYASSAKKAEFGQTLRMAESAGQYGRSTGSEGLPSVGQPAWSTWNSSNSSRHASTPLHANEGEDAMTWQPDRPSSPQGERRRSSAQLNAPVVPMETRLIGNWEQGNSTDPTESSIQTARGRGQKHIFGPTYSGENVGPDRSWTDVTSDRRLVEHFMALYFCWEYPTFTSLSKEHFLTDFISGRPRYCSSLLVNAMLALGCRFSALPESRSNPQDSDTAGNHYFAEAKRLLAEDNHKSLTTIQALGLIAIREASCGRDSESFYYSGQAIRLAVEFGLHLEVADYGKESQAVADHEVRAATFWGAFALDQAWSLTLSKISHFSRRSNFVSKPGIVEAIERSEWVPYTDKGASELKTANQPSNVRSVYKCFCELSELVHTSLYTLYSPVVLTAHQVNAVYTRYINWYNDLPSSLRLGTNFTPAVLFVHMYYHFAILMLFRPFIKLRFIGFSVSPSSVSAQAANAIDTLVRSYDQLYTLQRTPSFVPYIVLASGIAHLALGRESIPRPVSQSVRDLKDMCSCHGFSQHGLNILRVLAEQWRVEIAGETMEEDVDEQEMAKARELCMPVTSGTNLFCPNMGDMFVDMGPSGRLALFSPFPMQGTPLLAKDEELENHGFSRA